MAPKIKNIIMFVLIGGAMIAGYLFFFGGEEVEPQLIEEPGSGVLPDSGTIAVDASMSGAASDLLPVLLNVKGIKLDDAVLSDPAFTTLRDSSILLVPDGTEGRPNPFAPIGFESISAAASSIENDISPAPNKPSLTPFSLTPTTSTTSTSGQTTKPKTPSN